MEDQFDDCQISVQQSSERHLRDKFQPQLIQIDQSPVAPHKCSGNSQIQLWESQQDTPLKEQGQPSTNMINLKNSLVQNPQKTMPNIGTQKKILQLINRNKILLHVKDRLLNMGYIYPKNGQSNLLNLLKENYLGDSCNLKEQFISKLVEPPRFSLRLSTFSPTSKFILLWQIFRIIQIMFLLWWVPFKIAFSPDSDETILNLEQALVYFMVFDLLIKLNVGIIDQGQIIKDRWQILLYFIKYELYEDIIYLATLIIIIRNQEIDVVCIKEFVALTQFLLNFFKLKKKIKTYEETLTTQSTLIELANLAQLVIVIFYFAHFMACVWYYVGIKSVEVCHESWISKYNLIGAPLSYCYGYSFYWATATMVTVGYGDVTGQNIYEVLCSIVLMFLASGIFAFSMNSIGQIFTNLDSQQLVYKRSLLLINHYMGFNEVQKSLQSRIRNYLKYFYEQEQQGSKNEINIVLNQLSNNLKQELLQDVQIRVLKSASFFTQNFTESSIRLVADHLKLQQATPKELIYQQNNHDDNSIYIIQKGEVQLIDDASGKILNVFTKGKCFGDIEFLSNQKRSSSAYSVTFCQLYKISREDFLNLIKDNTIDFQKFQQMKDEVLFKYSSSKFTCFACNQHHLIWDCKYLFYKPDTEVIIKKLMFHSDQSRAPFTRSTKRFLNIFHNTVDVDGSAIENTQKAQSLYSPSSQESSSDNEKHPDEIIHQRDSIPKQLQQQQQSRKSSTFGKQLDDTAQNSKRQSNRQSIRVSDIDIPILTQKRKSVQSIFPQEGKNTLYQSQLPPIKEIENRKDFQNMKSFHQLDELNIGGKLFTIDATDSMFSFQHYFPHNNFENVLNEYQRCQKLLRLQKTKVQSSKYRFYKLVKINRSVKTKGKKDQSNSAQSIIIRDIL